MERFWSITAAVLGVFLVMGIGAGCRLTGWLNASADRSLANLITKIMLPAYFISKFARDLEFDAIDQPWLPPTIGFATTTIGFGLAFLLAKIVGPWVGLKTDSEQRAFAICAGICNYGYIPYSLAETRYPDALIELILHNVGVELSLWSVGIAIITGGSEPEGGQPNAQAVPWWRPVLASPPLWAVLIALTLNQSGWGEAIPLPVFFALDAVAGCAIPMGLMLSGAIITDFLSDRSFLQQWRVAALSILFRQLVMPALMMLFWGWLTTSSITRTVVVLQAAMPAAIFPIVLVKLYQRDSKTALRVVLWTSIFAVFLIPIWLAVGAAWFGLPTE